MESDRGEGKLDFKQTRKVRVRANALGTRLTGTISVPPPHFRVSDYINSHEDFLMVDQEGIEILVAKDAISYLEALEEGIDKGSRPSKGGFQPVTAVLRERIGTLEGEMFIADGATLQAALNRSRRFIKLRNVRFVNLPEQYEFLAIGKNALVSIRHRQRAEDR
jgi:hypothetical protein